MLARLSGDCHPDSVTGQILMIRPRYDAGRLPVLWLRLLSDHARLRIEVWDDVPVSYGVPVRRVAASEDEPGRGLELVGALSKDWGWERVPGHGAKRVWAILAA